MSIVNRLIVWDRRALEPERPIVELVLGLTKLNRTINR